LREIAIIGATASGKSDLALEVADRENGVILSIDSLSIYKEIDIVSAKPSKDDLQKIIHFGIDEIYPNQYFSVVTFIDLYHKAKKFAQENMKNLIIVGGTSFYLKSLLTGISKIPPIEKRTEEKRDEILKNLEDGWKFLNSRDPIYASKIAKNDRYRLEKALDILIQTGETPTEWFQNNRPQPILSNDIPIFNISIERDILRERIKIRTEKMLNRGLVDEVAYLIKKYGRDIHPMKAIGIKETIQYFDGEVESIDKLKELISTHTAQLAKRQTTFNRTQFREFKVSNINNHQNLPPHI